MSILEVDTRDMLAVAVDVTDQEVVVTFEDGRRLSTPLDWYPRLQRATPAQRADYEIFPLGIHWPQIDEDLSIAGMLKGRRATAKA